MTNPAIFRITMNQALRSHHRRATGEANALGRFRLFLNGKAGEDLAARILDYRASAILSVWTV